jgi:hypothetical protein
MLNGPFTGGGHGEWRHLGMSAPAASAFLSSKTLPHESNPLT